MTNQTDGRSAEEPRGESLGEIIRTIVYALLIALVFRTFFFQAFTIPSGSMLPTLLVGDYLLVSKYSYGYSRFSMPFGSRIPASIFPGRVFDGEPERGDVIVFRTPANIKEDYIKRIIGLPGDKIQIRDGVLFINDAPADRELAGMFRGRDELVPCPFDAGDPQRARCNHFSETLPSGLEHDILLEVGARRTYQNNTCVYTVPEDHYFFLGDNRNNSTDSRFGASRSGVACTAEQVSTFGPPSGPGPGFVPAANMIGRADIILLSSDGAIWEFWRWRSERFFKSID